MATGQAPSNPVPAMRTYQPVEHPVVVIGQQYLAQYYVELAVSANDSKYAVGLAVSTKAWTLGENKFKVADINGTVIFHVKSKHLTLHDRRFIKDAAGNTLVNLGKKTCSWLTTKERSLISRSKEGTASAPTLYFLEIPVP
ncbi:hypothetical protein OIU77_020521 [Salix suchowensis]|uniref:Uncharacterized protein n=1 Tax=Salix suchowensis TaxID=1278906 RepID=A0ABQ9CAH2_9ROSI|nr:hypothetical protein OIU77_020521 [Salix suchowensis]